MDNAGVNKAVFVLVNSRGDPLTNVSGEDWDIWCDWLLIMDSKHNGYCDIISSGSDPWVQECMIWQHDGNRYVASRTGFQVDKDIMQCVPLNPGVRAYWNWMRGSPASN